MKDTIDEIITNYNKNNNDKIINYTDKNVHLLRKAFECCNTIKYRCLLCNSFDDIITIIINTIDEYNNSKSLYKIKDYKVFKPLNTIEIYFETDDGQLKLIIKNFIPNRIIDKKETLVLNYENLNIELRRAILNMINSLRKELYIKYFNSSKYGLFSLHRKLKTKKYKEFRKEYLIEFNKLVNYVNTSLSHSYLSVRMNKGSIPGTWSLETYFIDNL